MKANEIFPKQHVWCWLDIETTGLDMNKDRILEIALIVTKPGSPQYFMDKEHFILREDKRSWFPSAHPVVQEMHTKNGLADECEKSTWYQKDADLFIKRTLSKYGQITLVGNSIHFDRYFLKHYDWDFEKLLHYRMLDISALRIAADIWNIPPPSRETTHRAMDDVLHSMYQFEHYEKLLKKAEGT